MTTRADADTTTTPDNPSQQTSGGEQPPQGAIDRLKRERDQAAAQAAEAARVAASALKVDKVYEVLAAPERNNPPGYDAYRAAKELAGFMPDGTDVTAESVNALLGRLATVLPAAASQQPQVPMSPMAAVQPAAGGQPVETGPFEIGSPQATAFAEEHGMQAFYRAVQQGQFYPSQENLDAQATAYPNLLG